MALVFAARRRVAAFTLAALRRLGRRRRRSADDALQRHRRRPGPKVGEIAPDFSLPGATRYGLLRDPVTLSALRGKTVVLAFFFKAGPRG